MTDKLPCPFCGSDDIERPSAPWVAGMNDEMGCYVICSARLRHRHQSDA